MPHPKIMVVMESFDLQVKKRLMGFEPTTFCMASRRSSQLSYSRAVADSSLMRRDWEALLNIW